MVYFHCSHICILLGRKWTLVIMAKYQKKLLGIFLDQKMEQELGRPAQLAVFLIFIYIKYRCRNSETKIAVQSF